MNDINMKEFAGKQKLGSTTLKGEFKVISCQIN
jgi:hypothetical protein